MTDPGQGGSRESGLNPVFFALHAAKRFHLLILLAGGVGLAFGLFRAAVTPNTYQSTGKLYIRPSVRDNLTAESAIAGAASVRMLNLRETISNEMQVLSSPQLYQKIVEKVGVAGILTPYDPTQGREAGDWATRLFHGFQQWWFQDGGGSGEMVGDLEYQAIQTLRSALAIYPEPNTTYVNVTYTTTSPEQAKRIVDVALEAAKEVHTEVLNAASSLETVLRELELEEQQARAAEAKLRTFRLEREIYDYDAQRAGLIEHLAELNRQQDQIDLEIKGRLAERATIERIRVAVKDVQPQEGPAPPNPEFTRLLAQLSTLQTELLQLQLARARGGEKAVLDAQQQLLDRLVAETKTALEQEKPTFAPIQVSNPRFVRFVEHLDEIEIAMDKLAEQRKHVAAERASGMKRLAEFEAYSPELRQLELDAEQRRSMAGKLADSVVNLKTVERLNQLNLSNIGIHYKGLYEPNKIAPVRSKLLVVGVAGGVAAGGVLALALAFLDRRVRNGQDLRRAGFRGRIVATVRKRAHDQRMPLAADRAEGNALWRLVAYEARDAGGMVLAAIGAGPDAEVGMPAADLAFGLARHAGEPTVLVDCGTTSGPLQQLAEPDAAGWRQVVAGTAELGATLRETVEPGLQFLPCGPGAHGPQSLAELQGLLARLCERFRFVVLAVGDLEGVRGALAAVREAEGSLLVVRERAALRQRVAGDLAAIEAAGSQLLGVVLQRDGD